LNAVDLQTDHGRSKAGGTDDDEATGRSAGLPGHGRGFICGRKALAPQKKSGKRHAGSEQQERTTMESKPIRFHEFDPRAV
jgi:hypothetical protein